MTDTSFRLRPGLRSQVRPWMVLLGLLFGFGFVSKALSSAAAARDAAPVEVRHTPAAPALEDARQRAVDAHPRERAAARAHTADSSREALRMQVPDVLEKQYLLSGVDAHVTVSGKHHDVLRVRWNLASRPWAYQQSVQFPDVNVTLHFRKFIIDDTDGGVWEWDYDSF